VSGEQHWGQSVNSSHVQLKRLAAAGPPPAQSSTLTIPFGYYGQPDREHCGGGNWLLAALSGSPPTAVTVQIGMSVAQTLAVGTYTGIVTITPTSGANTAPATVQVTLVVSPSPQLTVTPPHWRTTTRWAGPVI